MTPPEQLDADAREYFTERAAIAEFDGELSRTEAEELAANNVFEYRLAGWTQWGVMVGQCGDDLDAARRWCRERFGARLVAVRRLVVRGGG